MKLKQVTVAVMLTAGSMAHAGESVMLDEVVVTAPAMEQPLVVETDPRKPRQPVPAHDGADYLKTIPGFSVIRKGGTDGDPVFRGMAGSRLNILLDGENILGGCGQRMDPPTAYIFPSAYDRITVLKGPQSVLYGAGGSAGTVMFERDSLRNKATGFEGSVMAGSFGRRDVMADVHGGSPLFDARGVVTKSQAGDYQDGNGDSVHSAYSRWSANAALGLTPNENTRIELSAAKSDGEAAYADRSMDGAKFARDNVGLKADWNNADHGLVDRVEAQLFRNYIDHVMDNYSLRTLSAPNPMVSNPDRLTTGGRVMATLNSGEMTQLKVGADSQQNTHTLRSTMNQNMMPFENMARVEDAHFENRGLFGEARHMLNEHDALIGGLRADWWKAQDQRANIIGMMGVIGPNPTANQTRSEMLKSGFVRYESDMADSSGTVYAGLGHAERFPDYWELISKESATTLSAFDTTRPEKTSQLDVGVTYRQGDVSASLSGFYSKVSDFILIQSGINKGTMMMPRMVSITRNVDATTWGGEAGAAWQFAEQWKVDGTLSYTRGINNTDNVALAQIAPLEGRIAMAYDDGVWNVGGLLRMVAAQESYTVNQGNIVGQDIGRTAGFAILSLNTTWRASKNAQLSAGLDNLTDRTYAEHLSRGGAMVAGFPPPTTRVNEMGRMLWAKANIKFE